MAIFQSPKKIFQRPKFPGKYLKFRRKSDFCQISGSEISKFQSPKNCNSIPPLDSLLIKSKKSATTRVARQGVPAIVCNLEFLRKNKRNPQTNQGKEGQGIVIDLLMGLFRGAVFRHGWGARKQPIKQPTETPTSTLALMGRFPSLMGRFPALMGRFTDFVLRGRFAS